MQTALGVRGVQRRCDLAQDAQGLIRIERSGLQPVGQAAAMGQVHDDPARAVGLPGVEHGNHMRVLQGHERLTLAAEAHTERGVVPHVRVEDLDRHLTAQRHVDGVVDGGLAAAGNGRPHGPAAGEGAVCAARAGRDGYLFLGSRRRAVARAPLDATSQSASDPMATSPAPSSARCAEPPRTTSSTLVSPVRGKMAVAPSGP